MKLWRELGRIRTRLLAVNLVVVLVPIVGLEFARLYERQLLSALEHDMRNQAVIVRQVLELAAREGVALDDERHEGVLRRAARRTRTRIRILDGQGAKVLDSHRDGPPEGPEPPQPRLSSWDPFSRSRYDISSPGVATASWSALAERVEVRRALAGSPSAYTRIRERSPSVILFVAEPLRLGGNLGRLGVVYVTRSTQPVLEQLHSIRRGLTSVLAAALAFTVLISGALAMSISVPLARLVRAAKRITAGERDVKVPVEGGGEIAQLGEAFAGMTKKLDDRMRYIAQFSADVAHEFKSPLTAIRGAAELLGEGAADDPIARAQFLGNIQIDADRLDRLVSRLLELSSLEAATTATERFDLREVIARVVARTHSEEQPVQVTGVDAACEIEGRASDIERALLNLVENALRFSPPGIAVTLEAVMSDETVRLVVSDRGGGVPDEIRERIFQRFFTTDRERSGTGLGLAIVQAVAEGHGGRVWLDTAPGAGAVFTMELARRPPP